MLRGVRGLLCSLALFPGDALAWGLQTHVYFAHWLVLALPFADPELRRVVRRLPRLVLAGACLPDLALAGKVLGTPAFRRSHSWAMLRRVAAAPRDDAELALAVGYASHLVSDVVAHNAFVPEHEARIARVPHVTHAIAEFAMDQHLGPGTRPGAGELLRQPAIAEFVARGFRCPAPLAARAACMLAGADRALRASPLPRMCGRIVARYYRDPGYRFDRYSETVKTRLIQVESALGGRFTDWRDSDPEGRACDGSADGGAGEDIARIVQAKHHA